MTAWLLLIALIGCALTSASNVMYYRRARDPQCWRRMWLHRKLLTRREYLLNRVGFWVMVASIVALGFVRR